MQKTVGQTIVKALVEFKPYSYRIGVQIVAINDMITINPIVDEFTLDEKLGFLLGL